MSIIVNGGGGYANVTPIIIPSGRMRGDIDGDGKFTLADYNLINSHIDGTATITDETQLLCADINNDGSISTKDSNISYGLYFDDSKAGAYTEITGNWTNNPNYATEDGQFYADIPITGMTANHSASVIVKGIYESGFFTKAECISGAIRIYAKLCPIETLSAVVSWGTGDGTAVITTESEDLTVYAEHIANADIHVTTEEKAVWSEKEVFIATYGVTSPTEIANARDNGKFVYVKQDNYYFPMTYSSSSNVHRFVGFIDSRNGRNIFCSDSGWNSLNIYALPTVTTDDTGKSLMVNSSGVWAKTLPADARINLGFLWGTAEPTETPVTGAGTIYFQIINDSGSSSGGAAN